MHTSKETYRQSRPLSETQWNAVYAFLLTLAVIGIFFCLHSSYGLHRELEEVRLQQEMLRNRIDSIGGQYAQPIPPPVNRPDIDCHLIHR